MSLATLSIDIVAKLAELQSGMDKAGRLSEKTARDIEQRFAATKETFTALGAVIAGAFAGGAVVQGVRAIIDGLDALNDAADATGASIGNLSALEDIAARAGTPFQVATDAVIKLNQALAAAKPGSDQAQALRLIGLSAEDLKRLDPAEALLQVALALSKYENDGNKARLVQELFGKSLKEVAPLLNDLAEKGKLNATVTAEQTRQAELFNKQLAGFTKNAIDAARAIAGPLLTALSGFAGVTGTAKQAGFSGFFDAALAFNTTEIGRLDNLNGRLAEITRKYAEIKTIIDASTAAGKAAPPELVNQLKALEKQEAFIRQLQLQRGGGRGFETPSPQALPAMGGGADKPAAPAANFSAEAERYLQSLQAQLDKTAELSAVEQALQRIRRGDLVFTGDVTSKRLLDLAAEIDATKEAQRVSTERAAARKADDEAATAAARENEKAQRDLLRSLVAATPSGQYTAVAQEVSFLNAQFEAGRLTTVDQWAETIRNATTRLNKDTEVKIKELDTFADQAGRNIQDALGSTVLATLKGDFDSIEKLWANMLVSLASQAIAADIGKLILGSAGGGSGGGYLATILGFLGFAKGGAFGAGGAPITAFANGGVFDAPTPFSFGGGRLGVMGEAGPEAVMPLRRGPGGRLGVEVAAGGGGGGSVVINVAAGVNRSDVVSAIQLAMQSVKGEIFGFMQARRVI